jgi:hypothetical protein
LREGLLDDNVLPCFEAGLREAVMILIGSVNDDEIQRGVGEEIPDRP